MSIESNYKDVLARVNLASKKTANHQQVGLLALSKKQPFEKVLKLNQLGHYMFGESYVQEAIEKIERAKELNIQWHFIGPIQSNKTKSIAQNFDWVQSVDSLKVLTRLNNQRPSDLRPLNVLLQVKVTDEETKRGFSEDELLEVARLSKTFENVIIRGIMSIPAPVQSYEAQLSQFIRCKEVFVKLQQILPVDTLSLGMSSDLEAAIEAGSTMVRIGADLFGQRK